MIQLLQPEIQRLLPHRYPFLLLDRVTEFIAGERIVGVKNLTANESAPGAGFIPAGLLIEMVAQLGAVLVLERPALAGKVAVVLGIPSARMLQLVRAGDTLILQAETVKLGESFGELRGTITCHGKLVAEGRMRFAIANKQDLQFE